jgi:hypothetical protein
MKIYFSELFFIGTQIKSFKKDFEEGFLAIDLGCDKDIAMLHAMYKQKSPYARVCLKDLPEELKKCLGSENFVELLKELKEI